MRAVKGAGATVVDLGGPFCPLSYVIQARDPQAGEQVYELDPLAEWRDADDTASSTDGVAGDKA